MAILVTGGNGQLGRALQKLIPDATFTDVEDLDITNAQAVAGFGGNDLELIINAAAYTAVDNAETDEGRRAAWDINAHGVANLALLAKQHDATFVHVSTDYVFDGKAREPYRENAQQNPQSVYGVTKAAGELAARLAPKHYTARTSWVFGEGKNFVNTMIGLADEHKELTIVKDQVGRPTFAEDLGKAILELVEAKAEFGTYNITNSGEEVHWAGFAEEIFALAGKKTTVQPITTAEFAKGKDPFAPRPEYSVLDLSKLEFVGIKTPSWQDALERFMASK